MPFVRIRVVHRIYHEEGSRWEDRKDGFGQAWDVVLPAYQAFVKQTFAAIIQMEKGFFSSEKKPEAIRLRAPPRRQRARRVGGSGGGPAGCCRA